MLDTTFAYMTVGIFFGGLLVEKINPAASTKYVLGCFVLGFLYGAVHALM